MKHLSQEEMVEQYYETAGAEASRDLSRDLTRHLEECEECAAEFAAMESDLNALRPMGIPERGENYGEQMWARVASSLPARPLKRTRLRWWRGLAYAAGVAVLVAAGFYGGTIYEQWHHHRMIVARGPKPAPPAPPPKVVVVILSDHLDRSERLLVELKHADADEADLLKPLPDEARNLLAANHVFRDDAAKAGDQELAVALDKLDTLLADVAEQRSGLSASAIARLQKEMTANGLLFEVRVLRAKDPHRNSSVRVVAKGGTA
jgi:hypothetical protein